MSRRDRMRARIRKTVSVATSFEYGKAEQKVVNNFGRLFESWGLSSARLDEFVINHLKQGALSRLRDEWTLQVADEYVEKYTSGGWVKIPANDELEIEAGEISIPPQNTARKFWNDKYDKLKSTGVFELVEMFAYYWEASIKHQTASNVSGGEVVVTLNDAVHDVESMESDLQDVLKSILVFMQDNTVKLNGNKIADQFSTIVLGVMEDADFITAICNPTRDVTDEMLHDYFWNKQDKIDVTYEACAIETGLLITDTIEALSTYRDGVDFSKWMMKPVSGLDACPAELSSQLSKAIKKMSGRAHTKYRTPVVKGANLSAAVQTIFHTFTTTTSTTSTLRREPINSNGHPSSTQSIKTESTTTRTTQAIIVNYDKGKIRQVMMNYFNFSDLKTMAFDLEFDHENFDGSSKRGFALDFVSAAERVGLIEVLCKYILEKRGNVSLDMLAG